MLVTMLKSKLHNATVTDVQLDYEGSLSIDADLMAAVRILPYEKVLVANLKNGERFETYAIPAPRGSGTICLNGAAAHLGSRGDRLIVFAFAAMPFDKAQAHKPLVLVLGPENKPAGPLKTM